jgi:SAM-dependent methyltransferase
MSDISQPHMYSDLAGWWPLLSHPGNYAEEAQIYTSAIQSALPEAKTLLELGSGGGNNASYMKAHFQVTLVDRSPDMLAVSRQLNPELPHHQGDMRDVRLGQLFDVVFIHDAVMYMTSQADLLAALQTAAAHLRLGGVLLVVPDCTTETFRAGSDQGGHDGENVTPPIPGRAMRYLEWSYDPDPGDETYEVDYVHLLHQTDPNTGSVDVRCIYDKHVNGLFPRAVWLSLLEKAGFQPWVLPFDHSEVEGVTELFLGRKAD